MNQEELEERISQFIKNRYQQKNESVSIRFIHIRFEVDEIIIEQVLEKMVRSGIISKYYDENFEEFRYKPKSE